MKSLSFYLLCCLGSLPTVTVSNAQGLITFDDLSLQTYGGPIPNGYAGLEWDNFGVLDPRRYPGDSVGYLNGMVSPGHVAFNAYAKADGTVTGGFHSSSGLFDLHSAYLTAAWNDGLQVNVHGFVGGVLTYSGDYSLSTTGPTLVNFNYLGIDTVEIISFGGTPHGNPGGGGTQTAIDNLVITVPELKPIAFLLLAACFTGCRLATRHVRHQRCRQSP